MASSEAYLALASMLALSAADQATGRFHIVGSTMYDPAGKEFVPLGVNLNGKAWVWGGVPHSAAMVQAVTEGWRFNMVRINNMLDFAHTSDPRYNRDLDLQAVVDAFTSRGVVVMFEQHDVPGNATDLAASVASWTAIANQFKGNSYVWINPFNEPGGLGTWSSPNWVPYHQAVIKAVRDTAGADNIIVLDGISAGQDQIQTWGKGGYARDADSAILTWGSTVATFGGKTYPNVGFSVHTYGAGALTSVVDGHALTEDENVLFLADYIDRIHAKNLWLMVGETGSYADTASYNRDLSRAVRVTFRASPPRKVGILGWHGQPGDGYALYWDGSSAAIDRLTNFTNPPRIPGLGGSSTTGLTWIGALFWDVTHSTNLSPVVVLTAPAASSSFTAPATVSLAANATDSDGTVAKVEFFNGGIKLGEDTTAPYTFSWTNVAAGTYTLTAKATDNLGATTTSTEVLITVKSGSVIGTGTGLAAHYFDNANFTGTMVARTDARVDFNWGIGSPDAKIGVDTFSARWTGQIQAQYTENYTFSVTGDDGVRLWVGGKLIIDKWIDQAASEWSGSIAMSAGQKADIKLEYYENGGSALVSLAWSSSSQIKQVVPQTQLYPTVTVTPFAAAINFQPAAAPAVTGYLVDGGSVYADRGNGRSYGWNLDNSTTARDRELLTDQLKDTLQHMQKAENPNGLWEIAVPNGLYQVHITVGDAANFDSIYKVAVEGTLAINFAPTTAVRFSEATVTVTVTDGRLTVSNAIGASNNKICFIEILQMMVANG